MQISEYAVKRMARSVALMATKLLLTGNCKTMKALTYGMLHESNHNNTEHTVK